MEKCKSIIPVWIMPLEKVIENIKPSKEQFDVVIFDEVVRAIYLQYLH
ncbi:hypothetical protein CFSAN002369_09720 [Clostridium botulinum CFSAN002369]|nr:hypothetical protein CFSAN002369_09720 [Clostridium botulinum CFSAN002369]